MLKRHLISQPGWLMLMFGRSMQQYMTQAAPLNREQRLAAVQQLGRRFRTKLAHKLESGSRVLQ